MFWSWPSGLSWLDWAMHVDPCFAYCVFTSQTCCFLLSVVPGVPGTAASIVYSLYLLPLVPKVVTPYPSQAPSHGSVSPWDKFSNLLWRLWFFLIFYLFTYLAVPDLGWGMQDLHSINSSSLAWRVLWTEEPGGLLFIGSHRAGYDWSDLVHTRTH